MGARTTRLTLYSIILGLSICVTGLATALAVTVLYEVDDLYSYGSSSIARSRSRVLLAASHFAGHFGIASGVVALLTLIWTSVLLAWNNKPRSKSGLAISLTHFISFIIMSLVWLAVGIMLLTETAYSCITVIGFGSYLSDLLGVWCSLTSATGALSLVISILCGATALVILLTTRKVGGIYAKLVAPDGVRGNEERTSTKLQPMKHATRVRTALYSLILVFALAINGMTPVSIILTIVGTDEDYSYSYSYSYSGYTGGADTAFMAIALACSLFTWIWASVLLAYHRRIMSTETITRASAHCISTMVLSIVWFVLGIIILGLTGANCTTGIESYMWGYCAFNIPVGVLALCLSILLDSVSLFIYIRIKRGGGSLSKSHVAQFDGGAPQASNDSGDLTHDFKTPVSGSVSVPTCHHCCHNCGHTRA